MTPSGWRLERGATVLPSGGVRFSVWAPRQRALMVRLTDPEGHLLRELPMERQEDGLFTAEAPGIAAGTDYAYVLDDGAARPDPLSRLQPQGVHGPSRVVNPHAFSWTDGDWRGRPLEELIFYEAHVGTFTPEGTFDAVIGKLPHLRELGVSALELMPVASFPGNRNWGYDGVNLYAPHVAYGGPEGLRRLVDAAHRAGIAVVLDVVYNHIGPEGNYLSAYAPFFTGRYHTPWGDALNYDDAGSDEIRRFFIDNALYWLHEYHIDGLRLDAVHGIFDFSGRHILEELADNFHSCARRLGRRAYVIAESDLNDARVIRPASSGGWGMDAQWSDDFHHALHVTLTGNRRGYFADFHGIADLAKAFRAGYVYDGVHSPHRGRRHGNSAADLPGERFVVFAQNHDQIANGAQGKRLGTWVGPELERVAATLLFCAPYLPLLFMGQEYGETAPFYYFTAHGDPTLASAVREGRRREFLSFFEGRPPDEDFPDPQSEESFQRSKLSWRTDDDPHTSLLRFYKELIALRRRIPALSGCRRDLATVTADEGRRCLTLVRRDPGGGAAVCLANLGEHEQTMEVHGDNHTEDASRWTLALHTDGVITDLSVELAGANLRVRVPPRTAMVFVSEGG